MTSTTSSVFPIPSDSGRSAEAAPFVRSPRHDSTKRSFEDFCRETQCSSQPEGRVSSEKEAVAESAKEPEDSDHSAEDVGIEKAEDSSTDAKESDSETSLVEDGRSLTTPDLPVVDGPDTPNAEAILVAPGPPIASDAPKDTVAQATTNLSEKPVVGGTAIIVPATEAKAATQPGTTVASTDTKSVAAPTGQQQVRAKDGSGNGDLEMEAKAAVSRWGRGRAAGGHTGGGKNFRENFAAKQVSEALGEHQGNLKDFVSAVRQRFGSGPRPGGTDTAMLPDSMKLSPKFSVRPFGMHPVHSPSAAETSGEVGERFFWKGWTKGGGEPVSPAARISQAPTVLPAVTTLPANVDRVGPTVVQTQTPTPAAPVPNAWAVLEPKVALAPVGAAIQRLVAQGQEQLSVTIRFEQGGSLSVRLGMQNGEIAARIQTDVAGLDKALKSGWGEFAQDWNGRGIKLAVPVITASANAHSHGEQSPNGSTHRDGHHRGQEFSEAREERGSFDRGFQSRRHPRGQQANVETVVKNATSKTNRAQRNLGALQTWA